AASRHRAGASSLSSYAPFLMRALDALEELRAAASWNERHALRKVTIEPREGVGIVAVVEHPLERRDFTVPLLGFGIVRSFAIERGSEVPAGRVVSPIAATGRLPAGCSEERGDRAVDAAPHRALFGPLR